MYSFRSVFFHLGSRHSPGLKMARTSAEGQFSGMVVYFIEAGIQPRRLQVWKQKLEQLGAEFVNHFSRRVTHIFAMNSKTLSDRIGHERLKKLKCDVLSYQWLEDCLKEGSKLPKDHYHIEVSFEDVSTSTPESVTKLSEENDSNSADHTSRRTKRSKAFSSHSGVASPDRHQIGSQSHLPIGKDVILKGKISANDAIAEGYTRNENGSQQVNSSDGTDSDSPVGDQSTSKALVSDTQNAAGVLNKELLPSYNPPDLNQNITKPFEKLRSIYKDALGDDRRSFSYNKALSVLEKIPFKIVSVDQVKGLPAIGKSMQEHIQEILQTGQLSKLDQFEKDEKIRTISLFGEVWGIGPATALKLYEKGHQTLEDLKKDDSLTPAQRIGLEFFDDIKRKIPRNEVQEMESLLQRVAQDILPGVQVVCGGSYRRGKAFCGDMDFVITHPDGRSHKGFLPKFVKSLKDIDFMKEDLRFSIHSIEGTNSGVDTYFGLCKYPGREQRHRIDFKVYPLVIYAFGLIAWTGNDVLNRRLRLLAEAKGYKLDDTGLFSVTRNSTGRKVAMASSSIQCKTEREVFDFLGFPWLEPHERNL